MAVPVNPLPERNLLLALFEYRPDTGRLVRRSRPREMFKREGDFKIWNKRWAGKLAGSLKDGEITISLDYAEYRAHRLIWKMMRGDPVPDEIDHKDHDPHNNRIENLRAADASQNKANRPAQSNNTSGVKGVSYNKRARKFVAYICFRGKHVVLGLFNTIEEASAARREAAEELHGEFVRHE